MSEIHHLPLTAILPHALPRDRSQIEPEALAELQLSIATSGLRQPIEVFELATPEPPFTHGLISGLRRLTAHQALAALRQNGDFTTIAAFLRQPRSIPHAIALMIEENEARADLSPWEKGRILVDCVSQGIFETLDQAVKSLHPNITRQKRTRLRACATVVEDLEGRLPDPGRLTEHSILRLSSALRGGFVDLIHQVLKETMGQSLETQWAALQQTLN